MEETVQKRKLRHIVAERRKTYTLPELAELSGRITDQILKTDEYRRSETVFAYMDLPGEVQTGALIRHCLKDGKRVAVPVVRNSEMNFYEIRDFDHLRIGAMSIREPDPAFSACLDGEEKALMFMPGVAFDRNRNRIGYGGGYYDRYLQLHTGHFTIAVAFDFQIFDMVPRWETDIRPEVLITPDTVIRG